jgi:sulfate adenylyltransferase subunit 2
LASAVIENYKDGPMSAHAHAAETYHQSNIARLEAEAVHIIREVIAEFDNPVMLYSIGKDSSVMLHLAMKALAPGGLPFPLLHVDTTMKFPEMIEFRDEFCAKHGLDLRVHINHAAIDEGANPWDWGTVKCCGQLKTQALLAALREGEYDAAFGGARRDEEKSRAKERIYSFRDRFGQWAPKAQRPELWSLYNGLHDPGASIRVFPLSNWTELDIWTYIHEENIEINPLYYARKRLVVRRGRLLIPYVEGRTPLSDGEAPEEVLCRYRTLGCWPCTGAVESSATTIGEIIEEMMVVRDSERITRVIDHDQDSSMEQKKREGYF